MSQNSQIDPSHSAGTGQGGARPVPARHVGDDPHRDRPILSKAEDKVSPDHYPWHSHIRAQLVYASRGVLTVATEAGTWVVPPQQAVWVPAAMRHAVSSHGPVSLRFLYVHPEAARDLPPRCQVIAAGELLRALIDRASDFPPDYGKSGPEMRLCRVILDELAAARPEPLHLPLPDDRRLTVVTDALLADPADGRGLAAWSREAGASERSLARLFLKQTGLTFGAWRQRLRLLAAVQRLAEGRAVTEVAYDLGYDSPSAFVAMFRRALGRTPGKYLGTAGEATPRTRDRSHKAADSERQVAL